MLTFLIEAVTAARVWLPKAKLSKLTGVLALCLAAWVLASVFPLDLAIVMAGDWAAYFEVLAAAGLLAANAQVRNSVRKLAAAARGAIRQSIIRVRARAHARSSRAIRSSARRRIRQDDDAPGRTPAFA